MMTSHNPQKKDFRFAELGTPGTIWAIPSVHGDVERLSHLHDQMQNHICPGDRIIYLGNMIGIGSFSRETVDELLRFRRSILSIPGMQCDDFVYLRGAQEEMIQRIMQIQFATNPRQILDWMAGNGIAQTLASYGVDMQEGYDVCALGVMPLSRWSEKIRSVLYRQPGHEHYFATLRRAAFTSVDNTGAPVDTQSLLFVNSGLDMSLPLHQQGDRFWWGRDDFSTYDRPYRPFDKVIRGYDPHHKGLHLNCVTATLDNGCGFGGSLICARLEQGQDIASAFEA